MRDYLDEIKTRLLVGNEAAGGSRGARRKLLAIGPALAPVALVAGVLIASATGTGRRLHSDAVGSVTTGRSVGPVPAGFRPESFTAISDAEWWLLGSARCRNPPCTSIVTTADAGRTFSGLPAPRTTKVSQLRFADRANGYAFDPQLWSTHDGGETWRQVDFPGNVVELAAADGWVFALAHTSNGGRLLRSPVGSDSWQPVLGLQGYPFSGLWVQGAGVTVETQNTVGPTQILFVSTDSGSRFVAVSASGRGVGIHRLPPSIACQFEGALPVVWADCATGTESGVWRSRDSGGTFHGVGGDATRSGTPMEPNSAAFAAASPTIAVYGYRQLWRTGDAGVHWSRVAGTSGAIWWTYLGFTDATHGVAIGQFPGGNRLYYTTDGGRSYRQVAIQG